MKKKEFFRNFIDEIELYSERQSEGRIVKQINFNFPVYYNGNEDKAIRLPDKNTVEESKVNQRFTLLFRMVDYTFWRKNIFSQNKI